MKQPKTDIKPWRPDVNVLNRQEEGIKYKSNESELHYWTTVWTNDKIQQMIDGDNP